jgi:hypothetical protein
VWCDACAGEVWTEGGCTLDLFQGWGVGSEVLLEQVQLNFRFRNKFIILLQCGLQKCAFLKVLLPTLIVVVMKTEMAFSNNNKIKDTEELMLVILNCN